MASKTINQPVEDVKIKKFLDMIAPSIVKFMSGEYIINVLEPKTWDEQPINQRGYKGDEDGEFVPEAFLKGSKLSQHISFLKDFFLTYKDFTDSQIDVMQKMNALMTEITAPMQSQQDKAINIFGKVL